MDLLETFDFAAGSTAGRRHRTASNLANNQDAVGFFRSSQLIIGAVSDGCGSQPHSEYGARTTVNYLLTSIRRRLRAGEMLTDQVLDDLHMGLAIHLGKTAILQVFPDEARSIDEDFSEEERTTLDEVLNDYMMATAGAVVVTEETTLFIGAGDFVFLCNGEKVNWEPREGNRPLYPALRLSDPDNPQFVFRTQQLPTSELHEFAFATDGGKDLIVACETGKQVPGKDDEVGSINQLWARDEFYKDPDALGDWLNTLARNYRLEGPANHGGLLEDDTTVFIGRRAALRS